jgi:hypothetical protein
MPASVNSLRMTTQNSCGGLCDMSQRMAVVLPAPKLPVITWAWLEMFLGILISPALDSCVAGTARP